jgi:hypothetical protein
MGNVTNIKMEPCRVIFGEDEEQVQTITTVKDTAGSLNNKYFFISDAEAVPTNYYVWFNVGAAGADPTIAGYTAAPVAIAEGATAEAVATALKDVLHGLAGFTATVSSNVVTVSCVSEGYAPAAYDSNSGFAFAIVTQGDKEADLGFIDGDIEITTSEDLVDITSHQTGTNVLSQVRTGKQVEASITLKETNVEKLRYFYTRAGGSFTPVGADSSEVFGWGTYKDFSQTYAQAGRLTFHPVALGAADKSRDLTCFKAYPQLESLSFSGENLLTLPVSFKCYPNISLNQKVEYFAYGDSSQTLT